MFKVEISSVQTITHSKDPEKYTCKANVKITTAGKMGEFFGDASGEITRMQDHTMTEGEARKLEKYSVFAKNFASNQANSEYLRNLILISPEFILAQSLQNNFNSHYGERVATPDEIAIALAIKTAIATTRLYEPKSIEFVSTTAQQDGKTQHLVEIQKMWEQPDSLLIELAKFAKTYVPAAPAKAEQPVLSKTPANIDSASGPTKSDVLQSN